RLAEAGRRDEPGEPAADDGGVSVHTPDSGRELISGGESDATRRVPTGESRRRGGNRAVARSGPRRSHRASVTPPAGRPVPR
ncbi:hypothetical protein DJ74_05640, partial [Halorubrum sp. Ea8]